MRLVFSKKRQRFETIGMSHERHLPKTAGFHWDSEIGRWWTTNTESANKLIKFAEEDARQLIREQLADQAAAEQAAIAASRATDVDIDVPAPSNRRYYGYQRAGVAYALQRRDTLIADEMGLGKTIQAIGVMNVSLNNRETPRILIVAPKIALPNWQRELGEWLVKPLTIGRWTTKSQEDADIVIINYDILPRPSIIAKLRAIEWDIMVVDEAHVVKNPSAARTKAVFGDHKSKTPPINAQRRLFLTGTPILNRPIELFPMLRAMGLPIAQNYYEYAKHYCDGHNTLYGFDASGASNLDELQRVLRSTCMVRRLKADVLTELPPKRYQLIEFDALDAKALNAVATERGALKSWNERIERLKSSVTAAKRSRDKNAFREAVKRLSEGNGARLAEISRLRLLTALAKIPQVVEHVVGALESTSDAVLLFAHHRDVIAKLRDGLAARGYDAAVITGEVGDSDRERAQADIREGKKRLFIGSMHACGVAINLPQASTVIFAEQDWTPGIMAQCEDRAHRIGQANAVLVQHLVLAGSIDALNVQDFLSRSLDPHMAKAVAAKERVIEQALDDWPHVDGNNVPTRTESDACTNFVPAVEQIDDPAGGGIGTPSTITTSAIAPSRKRGRPPKGNQPLTKAQRNRRWREKSQRVTLEVPQEVVELLRRIRAEHGGTNGEILRRALSALRRQVS